MARHRMVHEKFARLAERVMLQEPPCMSEADDWESNNRWIDDLVPALDATTSLPALPDAGSERLEHVTDNVPSMTDNTPPMTEA